ncbi:probable histidine biosynthesis trifunctional protein (his-3) [Cephalotrichum gorgonifer]|uniref:Histidine biosynthesis trifunctional protein n=1 Tax=Cephalotrichum gorgonifer TaxID=2041049 RepID=A0AAE8SVT7_9PEZI|nr:probable histidine biosynthesis trifunctional protein (his-3) [Cephalotrichum gorgonifer]
METTLPLPFLVSTSADVGKADGLTREEITVLSSAFLEAPEQSDETWRSFRRSNPDFLPHFDASKLQSKDNVLDLLDRGAHKVFVPSERFSEYEGEEFVSRVAPAVTSPDVSAATAQGLLITAFDPAAADVEKFVEECKARKVTDLFLKPVDGADLELLVDVAKRCSAVAILPASRLTTDKEDTSRLQLSKLIAGYWKSDRADGLIPTVVCDEGGVSLGLAYTSEGSIGEAIRTQAGVYQSRKRGLWVKGLTSGDTQELVRIGLDCDNDTLKFTVRQTGRFCHLPQFGCFGELSGIAGLERVLRSRKESAPAGSYTARLFSDEKLLRAKIMEEAEELCEAKTKEEVAFEAADVVYFTLARAVAAGVSLADINRSLDEKSWKVKRRKGDAKGKWAEKEGIKTEPAPAKPAAPAPAPEAAKEESGRIAMRRLDAGKVSQAELTEALKRPSQKSPDTILKIIGPIIEDVRKGGDKAVLSYTHKFEKATSLTSPVLRAPFPPELMVLPEETIRAIDTSFENIRKFHAAQKEDKPLRVETMPGVVCSRFSRSIEAVGLYIPGGTAVLPSTALMLGVPAMVAGCKKIVFASPPRADGSITPEIVYVAHKVGAESIVLAGGAQAVAAMAYGTESVSKVDKILGPGNQFVTAAKMHVSNDTNAGVGIDMPAGPSEVLVVADEDSEPAFVASDLLSQAEHGVDSQVILIAVGLSEEKLLAIEDEVHKQAVALPRVNIVRGSIAHSITVCVADRDEAMRISNDYAPEHLILHVNDAEALVEKVVNAGSVFVGKWTPESVGDYSAGVNHSLPTYGFAKQYSGVNLASFVKHITSSNLTAEGLRNVGQAVMTLAAVEELEAHRRAVSIRLGHLDGQ